MKHSILMNQKGKISAGAWVMLIMLAAGIYIGGKVVPPWIDYYMIKEKLEAVVKASTVRSDNEILSEVKRIVDERGIPLNLSEDIVITRDDKKISISADWVVPVDFGAGYAKEFQFSVRAER